MAKCFQDNWTYFHWTCTDLRMSPSRFPEYRGPWRGQLGRTVLHPRGLLAWGHQGDHGLLGRSSGARPALSHSGSAGTSATAHPFHRRQLQSLDEHTRDLGLIALSYCMGCCFLSKVDDQGNNRPIPASQHDWVGWDLNDNWQVHHSWVLWRHWVYVLTTWPLRYNDVFTLCWYNAELIILIRNPAQTHEGNRSLLAFTMVSVHEDMFSCLLWKTISYLCWVSVCVPMYVRSPEWFQ